MDGLHRAAGSRRLIELHGNLDTVRCLRCDARSTREAVQSRLLRDNPGQEYGTIAAAPDGDAVPGTADRPGFTVPDCLHCGGLLKPDLVFFGEAVPRERTGAALQALEQAGCLLVAGTSLMVYSGYRYCRAARRHHSCGGSIPEKSFR